MMTERWVLVMVAALAGGCPARAPVPKAAPTPKPAVLPEVADEDSIVPEEVDFEPKWRGASFAPYLVPKVDFSKDGGAVDLVFQFHAGMMVEKEWRATHLKAVVVSVAYGMGSAQYEEPLRDPARFGRWIDEILTKLAAATGSGPLHLRRLAIVSFSAGFGAVGKILRQGYADKLDTLILLDSIHTAYTKEHMPDVRMLSPYVTLANEAKEKKRLFVLTHSAIKPPDYASSTETTLTLLDAVGVPRTPLGGRNEHGMEQTYRADAGALHAFGFKGEAAKNHMDHLGLVGDVVRTYVVRRWARLEALERRASGK